MIRKLLAVLVVASLQLTPGHFANGQSKQGSRGWQMPAAGPTPAPSRLATPPARPAPSIQAPAARSGPSRSAQTQAKPKRQLNPLVESWPGKAPIKKDPYHPNDKRSERPQLLYSIVKVNTATKMGTTYKYGVSSSGTKQTNRGERSVRAELQASKLNNEAKKAMKPGQKKPEFVYVTRVLAKDPNSTRGDFLKKEKEFVTKHANKESARTEHRTKAPPGNLRPRAELKK